MNGAPAGGQAGVGEPNAAGTWWLAAIPVGLAAAAYGWITGVGFQRDDLVHLYLAANVPVGAFIAHGMGGHALALFNLVFLMSQWLFGLNPEWWMATVLATHLLNVLLSFQVGRTVTGDGYVACITATLWGASIAAAGTLGWYSVYGQVLSTTLSLTALLLVATLATRARPVRAGTLLPALAVSWAGVVCFGTGLAFALVLPLIIVMVVPRAWSGTRRCALLVASPVIALALYVGNIWLAEASGTLTYTAGTTRGMLLPYLAADWGSKSIAAVHLLTRGLADLLLGLFTPEPPPLVVGGLALAAMLVASVRASPRVRWWVCALGCAALSAYAAIVAARGQIAMASALTHYQYQATASLALAVAVLLAPLRTGDRWSRWRRPAVIAVSATIAAVLALRGWPPAPLPGLRARHFADARQRLERAVQAAPPPPAVYLRNARFTPTGPILGGAVLFPGWAAMFCILFPDHRIDTRPVYFVETDPDVLAAAARGRCSATLMVPDLPPGALARIQQIR